MCIFVNLNLKYIEFLHGTWVHDIVQVYAENHSKSVFHVILYNFVN